MAARQRRWALRTHRKLIQQLGGACEWCGRKRNLELDCITPRGDRHHKMEWSWRISFYRAELLGGNLQVLCEHCNASKGDRACAA